MNQSWSTEKLVETWLKGLEEPLSDIERAELNRALTEHPYLRERLIHLAQEQSWLMWHGAAEVESTPTASEGTPAAPIQMDPVPERLFENAEQLPNTLLHRFFALPFFGIVVGFLIGALVAGYVVRSIFVQHSTGPITRDPFASPGDDSSTSPAYAATLVSVTNCQWDSLGRPSETDPGSRVRPGQVLRLVEGIAEISSTRPDGGSGRFVLEGPLAMVMTGDGTPTLQYGKLFAAIDPRNDEFLLGTPLGQVVVDGSASLGVVASGEDVTIHVFAGTATFELLWSADALEEEQYTVAAGSSLRLASGKDNILNVQRGDSNERNFIASVPMTEDRLAIGGEYVAAVRQMNPLAYWRFESDTEQCVRNEIADRLHLRIRGDIGWRDYPGNRSAELGVADKSGYLLTDEDFGDQMIKAYSVEAWVKPSHIHSGAILGLLDWSTETPVTGRHGILLDLSGPTGPWSNRLAMATDTTRSPIHPRFHPERLRFLQRVPLSADANVGTACYSTAIYDCRKWQHFAGVKDGKSLKLYINGQLVAEEKDENDGPTGLRALVGQVWPSGIVGKKPARQFVGEVDEVAVYGQALNHQEIVKHFRLGHGAASAEKTSK
jgi:hypothetical protein